MQEEGKGRISVTIQECDRLEAILELSRAVNKVATALSCVPSVTIRHCNLTMSEGDQVGISIATGSDVTKTLIHEVD